MARNRSIKEKDIIKKVDYMVTDHHKIKSKEKLDSGASCGDCNHFHPGVKFCKVKKKATDKYRICSYHNEKLA